MPCRGPDDDIYPPSKSVVAGYEAKLKAMKKQRDEATAAACDLGKALGDVFKGVSPTGIRKETEAWLKEHAKHDEARARKAFEKALKKHGPDAVATLLGDDEE